MSILGRTLVIVLAILGVVSITNCSTYVETEEISGSYVSKGYSSLERLVLRYKNIVTSAPGNSLQLESNGNCRLASCAVITYGSWTRSGDSIFIVRTSADWVSDSLRKHGFRGENSPKVDSSVALILQIHENTLLSEIKVEKDSETYKYVTEFVRE